jgi:hypothetical protein
LVLLKIINIWMYIIVWRNRNTRRTILHWWESLNEQKVHILIEAVYQYYTGHRNQFGQCSSTRLSESSVNGLLKLLIPKYSVFSTCQTSLFFSILTKCPSQKSIAKNQSYCVLKPIEFCNESFSNQDAMPIRSQIFCFQYQT